MAINLPYNLREGQIAYAAKVMANFRALLGAYNQAHVEGLGDGDVITLLRLLYQSVVLAGEDGNTDKIVFPDGETVTQKFNAGTLNASLLDSDGLFYFTVDPISGHLICTASEGISEDDFTIDENGHLVYTLDDPEDSTVVHEYDLGLVRGDKGDTGAGDMAASVYDPNGLAKDMNPYPGYFICHEWGGYFLTYDTVFDGDKTYYTIDNDSFAEAEVTPGDPIIPNIYYERLPATDVIIDDINWISGAKMTEHISGTSGHAFIGPAINATVEGKTAWQQAAIIPIAQGSGSTLTGATNTSSWIRLRALGTVPTDSIDLMLTFYM